MSSIKNKNTLFLGAALIIAAAYGYYVYNDACDESVSEPDAKAMIEVPVAPVTTVAEPVAVVPAIKVTGIPVAKETAPTKQSPEIKKTGAITVIPEGEQE